NLDYSLQFLGEDHFLGFTGSVSFRSTGVLPVTKVQSMWWMQKGMPERFIWYTGIPPIVGKNPKPEMKRIIEEIDAIKTKGKEAPFPNFDPSILFPQNRSYYTYQGSFTMPPCEECVTWIVMKEPINVDEQQMLKLRSLSSNSAEDPHCPLQDNWRPLQPLNNRMIRSTCQ
ncbi:hypothetical protein E2320_011504, partial [Naja naja]